MKGFALNKKMNSSSVACYATGGVVKKVNGGKIEKSAAMDEKQDKALVKKAIRIHDKDLHGGKTEKLSQLRTGGAAKAKKRKVPQMQDKKPLGLETAPRAPIPPEAMPPSAMPPASMPPASMPPAFAHGGTVHHHYYGAHKMADGGMVGAGSMGGMGGMGAPMGGQPEIGSAAQDPFLERLKREYAMLGADANQPQGQPPMPGQ